MANIVINNPVGVFTVEIKDSSNVTVYGPVTQTNAPFDPGITTPGDYVIYVTFEDNTNGFCWHITGCQCPIPTNAEIFDEGGIRKVQFTFDIPDLEEFCFFTIQLSYTGSHAGVDYPINISDISQLEFVSGSTYTKTISLIYDMTATSVTYQTWLGPSFSGTPCMQNPATVTLVDMPCIEAQTTPTSSWRFVKDGANYYVEIGFQTNCDTENCDSFNLNYLQTNTVTAPTGPPDSGSYSFTSDCSDFPAITYMRFLLNPQLGTSGAVNMTYRFTLFGCCNTETPLVNNFQITCRNQTFTSVGLVKIGTDYYIRFTVPNCGGLCHSFAGTATQLGSFTSGSANVVSIPSTPIDCDGSFPQQFDILLNPNLTPTDGLIQYKVTILPCCTQVQTFTTNSLPL